MDEEILLIPKKEHIRKDGSGDPGKAVKPVLREQTPEYENPHCFSVNRDLAGRSIAGRKGLRMSRTVIPWDGGRGPFPDSIPALSS